MKADKPIVARLTEGLDIYKLFMALFVWTFYKDVWVRYAVKNRTKRIRLADLVDVGKLREELDHVRTLSFSSAELAWLKAYNVGGVFIFSSPGFRSFLETFRLPAYELSVVDGQYELTFEGPWLQIKLWETIALAIINELLHRAQLPETSSGKQAVYEEGLRRLEAKTGLIKQYPGLQVTEFGTRRRAGWDWQNEVFGRMLKALEAQVAGTSNVAMAMDHDVPCKGTMAHSVFMTVAALFRDTVAGLRGSHNLVLRQWEELFPYHLRIALTDTFGTKFFFQDFSADQARNWLGLRQDSGVPQEFGEEALAFYRRVEVDPREKVEVFSDGLDEQKIVTLYGLFSGQIQNGFGWGTNLTNDLGLEVLSLVCKAVAARHEHEKVWRPTVKLSDNLAKATGPVDEVNYYKRVFGYTNTGSEECRY